MKNLNYTKLTFILSVLGFIGSLGFYFSVLKQITSEADPTAIEQSPVKDSLAVLERDYQKQLEGYKAHNDSLQQALLFKDKLLLEEKQVVSHLRENVETQLRQEWDSLTRQEKIQYIDHAIGLIQ
ncbi:MAG: hypothetical protein JKX76_03000 [Colwellia sp.]|nr:hypothetical protein [Colwellia sp.]